MSLSESHASELFEREMRERESELFKRETVYLTSWLLKNSITVNGVQSYLERCSNPTCWNGFSTLLLAGSF